jgi:flagellar biogenesis protein FliO
MKSSFRILPVLSISILVCVSAGVTQTDTGKDQSKSGIGSFDINKVRELSAKPQTVPPAGSSQAAEAAQKEMPNYTFVMLRIIGSLAIIIVLIFGVTWLIRKSGLAGSSRIGGGGSMDVLEVLSLGQNRNVVMFRVMDTVYLCGQTAANIALLDKIEGQRAVDLLTSSKGSSTVVQFKEAFNQFISKMKK